MIICPNCHAKRDAIRQACPSCGVAPVEEEGVVRWNVGACDGDGFPVNGFSQLIELEDNSFWFIARNKLILAMLEKHFPFMHSYLEIGCGTGYVLSAVEKAFPETEIYGSELFAEGLHFARKRIARASLMQMDALRIPFIEEFDVVGAFDVLEHIENDTGVLENINRSLKPGGGCIFTVPQHKWLWSAIDEISYHVRRYERGELEAKLVAAGFVVVQSFSFVSFLVPLMYLSRLRKKNPEKDPGSELKQPQWLTQILSVIMAVERKFILAGLGLPWGGSRLVVARKP